MDVDLVIVLVILLVCGAGGVLAWWNSETERTKRALRRAPVRPIGSLRDGELVRVQGEVRYLEGPPLVSPIGRRCCALYTAYVSMKSGKNSKTLIDENQGRSFLVQDETGAARIELTDYKLAVHQDVHLQSGTFHDPPSHLIEYLQSRGHTHTGFLGMNLSMWYREGVLEEGETVTVLGRVRFEYIDDSAEATGYRERPRRALIVSPEDSPMRLSDEVAVTGRLPARS